MAPSITLTIPNMSCAGCVSRIETAAGTVDGVLEVSANLANRSLSVALSDPGTLPSLAAALDRAGYGPERQRITLRVDGMSCASCVRHVEGALAGQPGVLAVAVNLASGTVDIETLDGPQDGAGLAQRLTEAGYPAQLVSDPRDGHSRSDTNLFRQAGLAAALTLPIVILEMGGHLFPAFHHFIGHALGHGTSWAIQAVLATAVLAGPGRQFFQRGIPGLLRGAPEMNTLVALGTGAAWIFSMVVLLAPNVLPQGTQAVYFEAAAVIATLILVGRALEARAKGRAGEAIRRLMELRPRTVRVSREGSFVETDISDVQVGDLLQARPGDAIAVDGRVVVGQSFVNESMISGEPVPVQKGAGDLVTGGTVNGSGAFTYTAEAVGDDTVLARIIAMVSQAQNTKLPIQALIDRVTAVFVPIVLGLSLLTLIIWSVAGTAEPGGLGLVAAISVLIVACPCAMGLATPMSIMVGMGRGAELGVLFRKGEALQNLTDVDVIAFDKTGTLTVGAPELTDLIALGGWDREEVLGLAAAVEAQSEHPIARAIVQAAEAQGVGSHCGEEFSAVAGRGVKARVGDRWVHVGTADWLADAGVDTAPHQADVGALSALGKTVFYVAVDGALAGILGVSDPIKPEAASVLRGLANKGITVAMVTGDSPATARVVADQLAIEHVVAGVLPDGKLDAVARLRADHGRTAFVGDGINDAPALAEADVGIALGSGTDVAIEAADVVLMSSDLGGVARATELSRATLRNIRQNLFWAFAYNVALIPVAAGVLYPLTGTLLSPMLAAGAMALSSVFVVGNALRLRRFARHDDTAERLQSSGDDQLAAVAS
ncbi:MAG: heavy metal translocating P-type ATPase [Pseudomonadota bacterium]